MSDELTDRSMKITAIFLLLLASLGSTGDALACKCAIDRDAPPEGSPAAVEANLEGSDAVFTATVRGMHSWARLLLRVPRYLFLTRGDRELTDEQEDRMFRRKVWFVYVVTAAGVAAVREGAVVVDSEREVDEPETALG